MLLKSVFVSEEKKRKRELDTPPSSHLKSYIIIAIVSTSSDIHSDPFISTIWSVILLDTPASSLNMSLAWPWVSLTEVRAASTMSDCHSLWQHRHRTEQAKREKVFMQVLDR